MMSAPWHDGAKSSVFLWKADTDVARDERICRSTCLDADGDEALLLGGSQAQPEVVALEGVRGAVAQALHAAVRVECVQHALARRRRVCHVRMKPYSGPPLPLPWSCGACHLFVTLVPLVSAIHGETSKGMGRRAQKYCQSAAAALPAGGHEKCRCKGASRISMRAHGQRGSRAPVLTTAVSWKRPRTNSRTRGSTTSSATASWLAPRSTPSGVSKGVPCGAHGPGEMNTSYPAHDCPQSLIVIPPCSSCHHASSRRGASMEYSPLGCGCSAKTALKPG